MVKAFLKPAHVDVQVRDNQTGKPLPADGAEVEMTAYWLRRERDGDVVRAKPKRTTKKAAE